MADALTEYLERISPGHHIGRAFVAAALLEATYDGDTWRWPQLTHLRALLQPRKSDLHSLARDCRGTELVTRGIADTHPLLALASTAVHHEFARAGDRLGRMLMFASLAEIVATDPSMSGSRAMREVARAVRVEIAELARNPSARPLLPDLRSPYDLLGWMPTARDRYADHAIAAWTRHVGPALLGALQHVASAPEDPDTSDLDATPDAFPLEESSATTAPDDDEPAAPASWWVLDDTDDETPARGDSLRHERQPSAEPSLSTYVLPRHLAVASPTYLPDADLEALVQEHFQRATDAATRDDRIAMGAHIQILMSIATGTPLRHVSALRWSSPEPDIGTAMYPGTVSIDGGWLHRPQLDPAGGPGTKARPPVHVPLPPTLSQLLSRLLAGSTPDPGALIFSTVAGPEPPTIRLRDIAVPHACLHRALISRLVRDRRYGTTLAQYVAGDHLGADIAPLHYDRISASDVVHAVARITFGWFGHRPIVASQPMHDLGSVRVPAARDVAMVMTRLRADVEASETLVDRIFRRTHYLVHGLCLHTGHRPNNQFANITVHDIGVTDRVALLQDKVAGADWMVRPVALAPSWVAEFSLLTQDLCRAAEQSAESDVRTAAQAAISGGGPLFLAPPSDGGPVRAYGLDDYLTGIPEQLRTYANYARHYANHALTKLLPVWLRVAQMGWHGTWDSAFADGSTWSVLQAAAAMADSLDKVLQSAGWRRTRGEKPESALPTRAMPTSWLRLERRHHDAYRSTLSRAKRAAADRREQAQEQCLPRLAATWPMLLPGLELVGREIRPTAGTATPVGVSQAATERLISATAAGDARTLQAHASRMLVRELILDARKRQIVRGPVPRGVTEHWPARPGPFMAGSARSLDVARAIDNVVAASGSAALRTIVSLLLYGGYGSLRASVAAMSPGTLLSTLESTPGVLLAEPPETPLAPQGEEPWMAGTTVWHDIAALELDRWHREPCELDLPVLDAELGGLVRSHVTRSDNRPLGWLREIEALARTCNTLRLDGWARLVGTGQVEPASTDLTRIVASHDDWPAIPRLGGHAPAEAGTIDKAPGRTRRAPDTIGRLLAAISSAVSHAETNRHRSASVRSRLVTEVQGLLAASSTTTPTDLIVLYAHYLLLYGGKRRETLALQTIGRYVRGAIPLVKHLPPDPLRADGETWTAALIDAVGSAEEHLRPERAELLGYLVWRLSEVLYLPADIDLGAVRAYAGRPRDRVDAGYYTTAELQLLLRSLDADVDALASTGTHPNDILTARHRRLCVEIMAAGALRSGEATGLVVRDTVRRGDKRISLAAHRQQGLKNKNARRCPRLLLPPPMDASASLEAARLALRMRSGSEYSTMTPLLHAPTDPTRRARDAEIWPRISTLGKWVTSNQDAVPYWLRKTGVRIRMREIMSAPAGSLWTTRELLAEIGHADPRITIGAYTHDPVSLFTRYISAPPWHQVSASRLATAAGVSVSTVARTYGARRLSAGAKALADRIAALLHHTTLQPSVDATNTEAPPSLQSAVDKWIPSGADVDAVLVDIAMGTPPAIAAAARNWPAAAAKQLTDALTELRTDHGVVVTKHTDDPLPHEIPISPPRRLRRADALLQTISDASQTQVLAAMCDAWLAGLAHAQNRAIVTHESTWARWLTALPALAILPWASSRRMGTRTAYWLPTPDGEISAAYMVRWCMLVAWVWRGCGKPRDPET